MLFQILDDKKDCLGVYTQERFYYGSLRDSFTQTWDWSTHVAGADYNYARLYCGGQTLDQVCPDNLKDRYETYRKKIGAFIKAISIAKINVSDICLFDLVPEQHLRHWCQIKNEICEYVFENYKRPANHKFLSDLSEMVHDIKNRPVKINQNRLYSYAQSDYKAKTLWKKFGGQEPFISYNIWGTITGRLSTMENTFPILNLKKEIADVVIPTNDAFLQLDFNGAEIRSLISLSGKDQPDGDIHLWNMENIYRNIGSRDKAKQRFFAWLYNPNSQDYLTNRFYNREELLEKHYSNGIISTPFGREIESDDFHALNYLLQSTSSDNCLIQAIAIYKLLKGRKSFLHSIVHDSITIDLHKEDKSMIIQIKEIFEDTRLGKFPSSVQIGKNYRDLEVVSWS